jgi:hypothetical protein
MPKRISLLLLAAAVTAAGLAANLPAQTPPATQDTPDDELLPTVYDREAGYRRRFSGAAVNPMANRSYSMHQYDKKYSARFVRTGIATSTGLDEEFPNLKPTLVTVAIKDTPPKAAAVELAKAMGFKIHMQPLGYIGDADLPRVTMQLDKKPALEAFLEFACQTGSRPTIDQWNRLALVEGESDKATGVWCVSGPFAFIVTGIDRSIPLSKNDTSYGVQDPVLHMEVIAEPRLKILGTPPGLDIEIMQDENANDLAAAPKAGPAVRGGYSYNGRPQMLVFNIPLKIPADAGDKIKIFRASGKFTVQTASTPAQFTLSDKTQDKNVGAFNVRVGTLIADKNSENQYSIAVTVSRGGATDEAWTDLAPTLPSLQPRLSDDTGNVMQDWGNQVTPGTNTCTYTLRVYRQSTQPIPSTLTVDVPTEIKQVTIPFVFRDLMLP